MAPGNPLCGRPIAASLPHDTALTAIVREGAVRFPSEVDRYEEGDIALVLATGSGAQKLGAVLDG
jgi:trk system potassium uptake protein TrkA